MYSPSAFSISDPAVIRDFLRENNFGILISSDEGRFQDTHTPFLISEDTRWLSAHIARANPQWHSWKDDAPVKVIFHGPHCYISPRYYVSEFNVPTWNYAAVSVDGRIRILDDPAESLKVIQELVAQHEGPAGWKLDPEDPRYLKLLAAVVCFSIEIDHLEAKFKLNQNKSSEDQQSVISHLQASSSAADRQTAELMAKMVG